MLEKSLREPLLDRLGLPIAGHRLLRAAATCFPEGQGGSE